MIRKHCPDATIEVTKVTFIAKHGTMQFTVHNRSMDGEIRHVTHQEEGPSYKGFMLRVSLNDGKYLGQAGVPQTLNGPYFKQIVALGSEIGNHSYTHLVNPPAVDANGQPVPTTVINGATVSTWNENTNTLYVTPPANGSAPSG